MPAICPTCARELADSETCPNCAPIAAHDPNAESPSAPNFAFSHPPQGIGGWLVLVAIGLVAGLFLPFYGISKDLQFLHSPSRSAVNDMLPGLQTMVIFELAINILQWMASVALIVLFFGEKRIFPRAFQFLLAFAAAAALAEYTFSLQGVSVAIASAAAERLLDQLHSQLGLAATRSVFAAVLWGSYMAASRRVRATFIH